MKVNYLKPLDGIRAIAALMVMFFHFFGSVAASTPLLAAIKKGAVLGQTGVSLFFVLSGFLITRILISTKDSPRYFYNFYLRRTVRIFPLYYLFLVIYYFIRPLLIPEATVPSAGEQAYYWLYLQDFSETFDWLAKGPSHYWSLAIEEHFYMFWPLLVFFLDKAQTA